jgi:hypothetical protein
MIGHISSGFAERAIESTEVCSYFHVLSIWSRLHRKAAGEQLPRYEAICAATLKPKATHSHAAPRGVVLADRDCSPC